MKDKCIVILFLLSVLLSCSFTTVSAVTKMIRNPVVRPTTASVKDFGAAGDGTTDDTKAIQRAINVTKSGILFFPVGNYVITKGLVVNSDHLVLQGSGKNTASQLVAMGNFDELTINGMRCTVDGLAIDGNLRAKNGIVVNGTQSEVQNCIIQNVKETGILIPFGNCNKNIRNCKIYTCGQSGIANYSNDMYIKDCEIVCNLGDAEVILGGANNKIFNCHIWSGDQTVPNPKTVGILATSTAFQIVNCVFDRINYYGIFIRSKSKDTGLISGNWFYQTPKMIHCTNPNIIQSNNFQ